eukprot:2301190-Alexandrium_andersonii.AAC.1
MLHKQTTPLALPLRGAGTPWTPKRCLWRAVEVLVGWGLRDGGHPRGSANNSTPLGTVSSGAQ